MSMEAEKQLNCMQWQGITCDKRGRLVHLSLCYHIATGGRGSGAACGHSCWNLSISK